MTERIEELLGSIAHSLERIANAAERALENGVPVIVADIDTDAMLSVSVYGAPRAVDAVPVVLVSKAEAKLDRPVEPTT